MAEFVSRWLDYTPERGVEHADKTDKRASVSFVSGPLALSEQEGDVGEPRGPCAQCGNDDGWLDGWQEGEASGWRCRACDAPLPCWYCGGGPTPKEAVAVALSESRRGCCPRHAPLGERHS
jgi:hypothetical protein